MWGWGWGGGGCGWLNVRGQIVGRECGGGGNLKEGREVEGSGMEKRI